MHPVDERAVHTAGVWHCAYVRSTAAATCAGAVPGLPARVVKSPVARSAAIGSAGHAPKAILTSPFRRSVGSMNERARSRRVALRTCEAYSSCHLG